MNTVESLRSPLTRPVAPIAAIVAWWLFCFGLYASGWPIHYAQTNFLQASTLLAFAIAALVLGYQLGIARQQPPLAALPPIERPATLPFLGLALLLALLLPVADAYSGRGLTGLDEALADQSLAYQQATQQILERSESRAGLVIVQTLAAPLTMLSLPYFGFRWFARKKGLIPFLAALAIPVVLSVLVGRDQQLGVAALTLAAVWLMAKTSRQQPMRVKNLLVPLALSAAALVTVGQRKLARTRGTIQCPPGSVECSTGITRGTLWDSVTQVLSSYATQGFEGLGRAFEATWQFGGGFSHSPALAAYLHRWGVSSENATVTAQLDQLGWSSSGYWSTAFAAVANDVHWLLIPVIYLLLGLLLAAAWRRAARTGDSLSVAVAAYTWVSLFYTPQNLQLAISGPLYVGYLTLAAAFLIRGFGCKIRQGASSSSPPSLRQQTGMTLG